MRAYPPLLARPYNFLAARVVGLEAEGELTLHPWWALRAGYTLLHSQNLKDDPRYYLKELPYRPRHKLHAQASFGPPKLQGRAEVTFQSLQYRNRTQTLALPARAFVHLGVASQILSEPRLTASLEEFPGLGARDRGV